MKFYYIYNHNGQRYEFKFYSFWAACVLCDELGYAYVVDGTTGEILAERG